MENDEYEKLKKLTMDYTDKLLSLYPETERFNLGFRAAVYEIRQDFIQHILKGKEPNR